jgi:cytochrome P450
MLNGSRRPVILRVAARGTRYDRGNDQTAAGNASMTMIYDPAHPVVRADPYPAYARLRAEDPVHWHTDLKCWILTRYDDVAAALSGPSMSPDRLTPFYAALPEATQSLLAEMMRYLNLWIVFRDPPAHTRVRGLVNKAFLPGTIIGFRPRIEQIVARLLDDLARKDEADLVADFTMPLPALVIMAMMGVPEDRLHDVKGWSDDIMLFIGTARATPDKYERARRGAVQMAGLFRSEIERRRADPGEDLLSLLIAARDEQDRLSEDELVATAMLLLFAGHETTTNLLSTATLTMMRHPGERARLAASPDMASTAVEEFLRTEAPTNAMGRIVRKTHEVRGVTLKEGDRLFAIINAANRDGAQFPDPDKVDLGRQPNRHLTFGQGPHFCLGAQLARLEARIALPALIERFPNMSPGAAPPVWLDSLVMRGLKSLPVRTGR